MDPNQQKLIDDQLKTLPVQLQRAITLTPWRDLVRVVAKNNNLDAGKSESLEMETMLVIYGFEPQGDFSKNLMRELSIDPGRAGMIARNINDSVFSVVLKKANDLLALDQKDTLQSTPNIKPEAQELAPKVVVETSKFKTSITTPSINLIPPPPEEKLLAPLKPRPVAPPPAPVDTPAKPVNPHYAGSPDPYREQV